MTTSLFRRLLLSIFCLSLPHSAALAQAANGKNPLAGQRTLWLGDSITQNGEFVTDTEYLLEKRFPKDKFDIISIGLASETADGLSEKAHPFPRPDINNRLQSALDLVKPTVVVACYGMNDGIYHPQSPERMQAFENGIDKMAQAVKKAGAKLILLTPPPFEPADPKKLPDAGAADFSYMNPFRDYDSVLADYAKWEMTQKSPDIEVIDLHTPMAEYLKNQRQANPTFTFAGDSIHPNSAGMLMMAQIIVRGLGVSLPASTEDLNAQTAKMQADPLYALVNKARQTRSDGWLAYVGYDRGGKVKAASVDQAEQVSQALQGRIDQMRAGGQ